MDSVPSGIMRSIVIPLILLLAGCISPAVGNPDTMEPEVRVVLNQWVDAVRRQDIDTYMNLHWGDAIKLNIQPDGVLDLHNGSDSIREEMEWVFSEYADLLSRHEYPPTFFEIDPATNTPQIIFRTHGVILTELLRFEERDGELKISEHWIINRFFPEPKSGELTAWADGNGDGLLTPDEQERLFIADYTAIFQTGPVENPAMEFFDWNGDGRLVEWENEIARSVLVRNRLRRIDTVFPGFVRHRAPPPDVPDLNIHDANWLNHHAVVREEESLFSGPVENENTTLLDFNGDGLISTVEAEIYQDIVLRIAMINPRPIRYDREMPCFTSDIREWVDADLNGLIAPEEYQEAGYTLWDMTTSQAGDPAWTPITRFFDRNRDGLTERIEIEWAMEFIATTLYPEVRDRRPRVWNWEAGRTEPFAPVADVEEIVDFFQTYDSYFWIENGGVPDETPHRWLDQNSDGRVEAFEADLFRDMLFEALMFVWLNMERDSADALKVRSHLDAAADINGDGRLLPEERLGLIAALSGEHTVTSALDRKLDFDGDSRLTRAELSRATETGYIPLGPGQTGRSITADHSQAARNIAVRPAGLRGSNLAVLGLRDMTGELAEAETELLISFIENAFVNTGNASVVDRQNLQKIMQEYEYQASGLVDEETAVEIGKLSGADSIAIGTLSRLEETYFLHLKVIDVSSGVIVGSSIAEASSQRGFPGMCSTAVDPLF